MDVKVNDSFTILIAEDNAGLGVLIQRKLTNAGFSAENTHSGSEVLEKCSMLSDEKALLLLDYQLGDMTAQDVIIELKKQSRQFTFVVMTGFGDQQVAVDMMKLGADDYLIKNDQFLELLVPVISQTLDRKRIQLSLAQTQKALDAAHHAIMATESGIVIAEVHETDCPIVYYNPAFELITGYHCSSQPTLQDWINSYDIQDQIELEKLRQTLQEHNSIRVQLFQNHRDSLNRHEVSLTFIQKPSQVEGTFIGLITDTTEKHQNEKQIHRMREELEQAQRRAIAGEITKELAHEIGHPLTQISSNIQFMMAREDGDQNSLSQVLQQIDRISNLLRRYSSRNVEHLSREFVSVNTLIQSLLSVCPCHEDISIIVDVPDDMPEIFADKAQVVQVLINLLTNAVEACNNDGMVIFSANTQIKEDSRKHYAAISVTNTGPSISPENISKVFEPFFSTKSNTQNRGLGLSISRNIALRHEGWIEVNCVPTGTCFTLMLPLEPVHSSHIDWPGNSGSEKTLRG